MKNLKFNISIAALITILLIGVSCKRKIEGLELATFPTTADVFIDGFSAGLQYAAFGTSKVTAFSVDSVVKYSGTASMKFEVPDTGDPLGGYAGGVFLAPKGRDLSGYNVLTFWAKASQPATFDQAGFGNDLGLSKYLVSISNVSVNSNWAKYYVLLPDPSVLKQEKGLFFYTASPQNGKGYTLWIDEVKFEKLGTIAYSRAGILNGRDSIINKSEIGDINNISGIYATFNLPTGIDQTANLSGSYFTFASSNSSVATVSTSGIVTTANKGSAVITGKVGNMVAKGSYIINSIGQPVAPTTLPSTPTVNSANVISLFSNAYTNVKVDSWNTHWQYSTAENSNIQVNGNSLIRYRNLNFVGIDFSSQPVDASGMTNFHMDIWTPDSINSASNFNVELVDFGANGVYGGGDDTNGTYTVKGSGLTSQKWISLDIPLSSLTGLTSKSHLAQLVLSGNLPDVYVDNVYFYKAIAPYSQSKPIDFESTGYGTGFNWSVFEDSTNPALQFVPNPNASGINTSATVAKFTALQAGAPYAGCQTDKVSMGTFQLDATHNIVKIMVYKSVISDVGIKFATASGWAQVEVRVPNTVVNAWQELTFDFSAAIYSTNPAPYVQLIVFPDYNARTSDDVVYFDNITFSGGGGNTATGPTTAAPAPKQSAANVISVFSDTYTNVAGTDLNPNWGQTTVTSQVSVAGNNTLKYVGLNYQGIALGSNQDVSGMGFLHVDFWTVNSTLLNVYLISPGPVQTPYALTVPTSGWSSVDIPLSVFSPVDLKNLFQLMFSGNGNIFIDNIYFYRTGASPTQPTTAAPTPTASAANVISIFSDAYTNVAGTDLNPNWGQTTVTSQVSVAGNNTLKYAGLNYQGIVLGSNQDVSGMSSLHVDVWTANSTSLSVSLISPVDVEVAYSLAVPTSGWSSFDIPLSSFSPVDLKNVFQLKFTGTGDIWVDNIYFYNQPTGGAYSLNSPIDFESSGYGTGFNWTVFEDSTNPALQFVANPNPSGINTSATVAKFTALQAGQPYAGCQTDYVSMGTFQLDAAHNLVKIMVYKTVISDVGIKFATASNWAQVEVKVPNTVVNAWEELTFDFSAAMYSSNPTPYVQLIVFPDYNARSSDDVVYFDNITFHQK